MVGDKLDGQLECKSAIIGGRSTYLTTSKRRNVRHCLIKINKGPHAHSRR